MVKREWFASWFDSPYYHILYKNRNETEARDFILNLLNLLKPEAGQKALDLACGKGRHSMVLAKNGLDVTGADLSEASIAIAKEQEHEALRFLVHDMRKPIGEKSFDFIFNLFTSFGYFSRFLDNLTTINAVHTALKDQGVFVIDFLNAKKTIADLIPNESKQVDGINFEIERTFENGIIQKNIYIEESSGTKYFQERVQALELEDFEAYFYNKLEILHCFGNYQLEAYNEKDSSRLILVAKKK